MQKFLQRFTVGKRMLSSFIVLLAFTVFIAAMSANALLSMRKQLDELTEVRTAKYALSVELHEDASQIYTDLLGFLVSPDPERRQFLMDRMQTSRDEAAQAMTQFEEMASSDEERQLIASVRQHGKESTAINSAIANLHLEGNTAQAVAMMRDEGEPTLDILNEAVDAIRHHEAGLMAQAQKEAASDVQAAILILCICVLTTIILGVVLALAITRSLTQPLALAAQAARDLADGKLDGHALQGGADETGDVLRAIETTRQAVRRLSSDIVHLSDAALQGDFTERCDEAIYSHGYREIVHNLNQLMATTDRNLLSLSGLLQSIAQGDLTQHMQGDYRGIFARMRDDANLTVDNLTGIVGRIQQAASLINSAANEIAAGNSDLSRRTEAQAANLEETAASMEELTTTVRQNNDHARHANQLAISASTTAQSGGEAVAEVVQTMRMIETASRRIADIISVIDGIAFQTNILALNAAVEAARAGEQGRGFAVVASEVRTLAQRSASAAKEIKVLIDDSVDKVSQGSEQVGKAGATMKDIVTSVQRVTEIMAEISTASGEQTAGIVQVNQTVLQMDEVTQQNASLVEEASAAAYALADQANQLVAAVSLFRLAGTASNTGSSPSPDPAPPPKPNAPQALPTRSIESVRSPAPRMTDEQDWNSF